MAERFAGRPEAHFWLNRSSPTIDAVLTALPFFGILFNWWLGPLTPVVVVTSLFLYIVLRRERVVQVLLTCWPLLMLPAFCLLSTIWSQAPGRTFYYGTLYLLTVLPALFIGAGAQSTSVLKGIFVAFCTYTLMSVLFGRWVVWNDGGLAFAGLAGSKNAAGDTAALTLLISVLMIWWAIEQARWRWLAAAVAILPFALFCLVASKATGVLIASIIALPCMTAWIISRRLNVQIRSFIFIIVTIVVISMAATSTYWMQPLFDLILTETGKDAGLTGRALLWRNADQYIAQRPVLGLGYNAFWVHGNLEAEFLWRAMGISNRMGFNFHNTPRDILVDIGYAGLILFALVMAFCAVRLIIRVMVKPTYFGIFCCTLLVFETPRIFFELVSFSNMHFSTLIVFTMLACALRPDRLKPLAAQ
ncbi:O-antigen ligase family protein [Blastomonas aquatica]|nr:O-antigen ligase family protein [Blastomonas aquatica]